MLLLVGLLLVGSAPLALASSRVRLAGRVVDAQTGAPLPRASVSLSDTLGTFCDAEGYFRLEVMSGIYEVTASMVGYAPLRQEWRVPAEGPAELLFRLPPQAIPMEEVVVERPYVRLPRFADVTREAGIDFEHVYGERPLQNILQTTGAGACFFDYDGDGDQDLYLVNGSFLDRTNAPRPTNALYRNQGDGTFAEATQESGTGDEGYGMGCAAADYDNDGDLDLYVTNYGPNVLYRNEGDGTFAEVGARAGVDNPLWSVGAAFADYDSDGWLDLFVGNYLDFDLRGAQMRSLVSVREGFRLYPGPRDYQAQPDALYRNLGNGTFADRSRQAGLNPQAGKAMGCGFGDYDNDGDPDLFVANDRTPNHFYRNDGGIFSEVAIWAGVAYNEDGHESGAMAVDFGDYDNDGWLDLLVTDFIFEYNHLYRNLRDGTFEDVGVRAGLALSSFNFVAWGGGLFDYDNDGHLDLFVANGHVHENIDVLSESLVFEQPNQLFHNEGDGTFTEVSAISGPPFQEARVSRGAAFADYDNDGDLDILVVNAGSAASLLRNDGGNREHWLVVRLVGTSGNRDAIGARVQVEAGSLRLLREVHSGSSYLSQSDLRLFFGLGGHDRAERVLFRWPGGRTEILENIAADRLLTLVEGKGHTERPLSAAVAESRASGVKEAAP
jgi:hypothetical protein